MSAIREFKWQTMRLHGRHLIEASAGTGKTHNLVRLFLRLILEGRCQIQEILLSTFTEAAAAELRTRIEQRLRDAVAWLEGSALLAASDDLDEWMATRPHSEAAQLRYRLRLALADLDRAQVMTIHAYCQRVLRELPFAASGSLRAPELVDAEALRREVFLDEWRRCFLRSGASPLRLAAVTAHSPEAWLGALREVEAQGEPRLLGAALPDVAAIERELHEWDTGAGQPALAELRRRWPEFELRDDRRASAALRRIIDAAVPSRAILATEAEDFNEAKLESAQRKARKTSVLSLASVRRLLDLKQRISTLLPLLRRQFLVEVQAQVAAETRRRCATREQITYDGLIDGVLQALKGSEGLPLARRLGQRHRALLIDECQDTDARQYRIFERIHAAQEQGLWVLIGDPKQSIYGFRGADIEAYLKARQQSNLHHLPRSFRAVPRLLEAVNAFYAASADGGFAHPDIRYQFLQSGRQVSAAALQAAGAAPLVLRCFEAERDGVGPPAETAAEAAAQIIRHWLDDPTQRIDERRLAPGDVAVLVWTHQQVELMRRALQRQGIACAAGQRAQIYASRWVQSVLLWLAAAAEPMHRGRLRAALAAEAMGYGARDLARWASGESELPAFADATEWARSIERLGPLAWVENLLQQRAAWLLAQGEGERAMTDLRHLGELLQDSGHRDAASLLSWLQAAIAAHRNAADERRELRLDSEAQRVQLMTVHASKGLEFERVLLPYAWRARGAQEALVLTYQREAQRVSEWIEGAAASAQEAVAQERAREDLRLLYVALTRARQRVEVFHHPDPQVRRTAGSSAGSSGQSPLARLLDSMGAELARASAEDLTARFAAAPQIQIQRGWHPDPAAAAAQPLSADTPVATAASALTLPPLPPRREPEQALSFTSLVRDEPDALPALAGAPAADESASNGEVDPTDDADPELQALAEWRGTEFGNVVHRVLDQREAGPLWPAQLPLLIDSLRREGFPIDRGDGRARLILLRLPALMHSLDRAWHSEIAAGLSLACLPGADRAGELAFEFAWEQVDTRALVESLREHGLSALWPAWRADEVLHGRLRGAIDLVFRWQGRYHVLDYKTNQLGLRRADYDSSALSAAMDARHYRLQALLYSVALHRHLRLCLRDYDPARDLGDSWYLFLRALGLAPGLGVWRGSWPIALIETWDRLFDGGRA